MAIPAPSINIFTELFGGTVLYGQRCAFFQTKGERKPFSAGQYSELIVYHHEQKNIQRISEFKLGYIYTSLHFNIVKNTVALYMIELLQKSLREPEQHLDLYYFPEQALQALDMSSLAIAANVPLYFTLRLAEHLGSA